MPAPFPSIFAAAAAEPATQPISVQTALLLILGVGLLLTVKSLAALHRRVDALNAVRTRNPRTTAAATGAPSPEILAVITAAVFESIDADHRIVSITSPRQDNPSWSQEGRRQVFAGRKVR
ncbi:MAG: hypothetical protein IPL39_21970 [Opitutaceae bacterium]|nr:hypothetical protein [Opitutaceae bacterium]